MYDKCYFCLDQLPKLKKESTASFFVNFGRNRGTKEPTYITVYQIRTEGKIFFRLNRIFKKAPNPLQDLTEDEIEEMMREADLDGDGKVLFK